MISQVRVVYNFFETIDFLFCEDKIRDYYHLPKNSTLALFQMEINNNNNNKLNMPYLMNKNID